MLGTVLLGFILIGWPVSVSAAGRHPGRPEPAPAIADRDGDGLPDAWERYGVLGTFVGGSYDWQAFLRIEKRPGGFVETGRVPIFHYAVFAHYHDRDNPDGSGASGIERGIGGTELLVTLGNFAGHVGTAREQ